MSRRSSHSSSRDSALKMLSCTQLVYNAGRVAQDQRRPSVVFRESQATRDSDTFSAASSQAFDTGLDNQSTDYTSENVHGDYNEVANIEQPVLVKATTNIVNMKKNSSLPDLPSVDAKSQARDSMQLNRSRLLPSETRLDLHPKVRRASNAGSLHYAEEQAAIAFNGRAHSSADVMCPRIGCDKTFKSEKFLACHLHIHVVAEKMFRCSDCKAEFDTQEKVDLHDCPFDKSIAPLSEKLRSRILNAITNTVPVAVGGLKRSKTYRK